MFCYQCEQTAKGEACTVMGVCGKQPEVASLQDLLVYLVTGISQYAVEGRKVGVVDQEVNTFTFKALFSTLTNVNFDPQWFVSLIEQGTKLREALKGKVKAAGGKVDVGEGPATFQPEKTMDALIKQGEKVGLNGTPRSTRTFFPCSIHSFSGSRVLRHTLTMLRYSGSRMMQSRPLCMRDLLQRGAKTWAWMIG